MTARKFFLAVFVAVVGVWILFKATGFFLPIPAQELDPRMQLGPYRQGMSLREVFDSFPKYGADRAELRLLRDNNLAWIARWKLLDRAQHSIDVSYFILKKDIFGVAFLSHLLKKARTGVKVRILLDAAGSRLSWNLEGNDYLDALIETGNVEIRLYRPLLERLAQGLAYQSLAVMAASEHDKILVVDGQWSITGGRNIANEYFADPVDLRDAFRDMEVEIHDRRCAAALVKAFETQFESASAQPLPRQRADAGRRAVSLRYAYAAMDAWLHGRALTAQVEDNLPDDLGDQLRGMQHLKGRMNEPLPAFITAPTRVLDSTTRFKSGDDTITRAAMRLLQSARREIFIQNPYIVVSEAAVRQFAAASRRSVPIVVYTNSPLSIKSLTAKALFVEQWPYLLARVPGMRLYANADAQMIHAKLATFDGTLSLVGTYNLSPLSMATNSEVVVAVWSRSFAAALTGVARDRLAAGPPHVYRYRIVRDAGGKVQRDVDGRPQVAFGPRDHMNLDSIEGLAGLTDLLNAVQALPGVSPFF